mmetsp:Transcript_3185/g.4853  ORF Transcript_3185/g.4853 Transcript_3185/m.4853 type:complete len:240 (+) Transcript_3185:552-1271(+)
MVLLGVLFRSRALVFLDLWSVDHLLLALGLLFLLLLLGLLRLLLFLDGNLAGRLGLSDLIVVGLVVLLSCFLVVAAGKLNSFATVIVTHSPLLLLPLLKQLLLMELCVLGYVRLQVLLHLANEILILVFVHGLLLSENVEGGSFQPFLLPQGSYFIQGLAFDVENLSVLASEDTVFGDLLHPLLHALSHHEALLLFLLGQLVGAFLLLNGHEDIIVRVVVLLEEIAHFLFALLLGFLMV